jgi:hypothetical protein
LEKSSSLTSLPWTNSGTGIFSKTHNNSSWPKLWRQAQILTVSYTLEHDLSLKKSKTKIIMSA